MMNSTFRFQKALASRDEVIVTGPYLDQWGSGHVITISKAIVKTLAIANLKKTFSKKCNWIWYPVLRYQNWSKTEKISAFMLKLIITLYDVSSHPCFFSSITKNNSFVVGVMAIDISITHFHQLLTDSYPICKEFSTRFVNSFRLSFVKE